MEKISEYLISSLMEHTNDGVIISDKNGKVAMLNPTAEILTGWNEKIAIGKSLNDIFKVFHKKPFYTTEKNILEILQKYELIKDITEANLYMKDGKLIQIEYRGDTIKDDTDLPIGFIVIFRDISRRKAAKQRLERAMNAGNLAWWEMELPSGLVDFNDRKARMLGYNPKKFENYEDFTNLLHPEDQDAAMQAMRDHLNGKASRYEVEYKIKKKSGDYKWFRDVGRITDENKNNGYRKITGIVIDIDERKKAEQKVKNALEQSNFYKNLLAHDMANLLTSIRASLRLIEMWKNEPKKSEEREDLRNNIRQQLDRGNSLISNVRKLSKLEEKSKVTRPVDVKSLLEEAIDQIYSRFQRERLDINARIPHESVLVKGGDLLLDVFENILLNGALHNDSDRKKIWVNISKKPEEGKDLVKIEFKDNGIGISEKRKKLLFEKAYQKKESAIGMGIGLSLVNRIISEYRGKIRVENRVEGDYTQGSNFIVLLREARPN